MATATESKPSSILETVDEFVAAVPWGRWRCVLVHRRSHGGRKYVRFRTWNKHRTKLVWYPSKRSFVIPIENADGLADALQAATKDWSRDKPDWFVDWEEDEEARQFGVRLQDPPDSGNSALSGV